MEEQKLPSMKQVHAYLASRGIPKPMVRQIQLVLVHDAITQGRAMQYDRIYAGIALMLRKCYGFGLERILKGLHCFDDIAGSVIDNPDKDWTDIMQELKDETGIVVRSGDGDRVFFEIDAK